MSQNKINVFNEKWMPVKGYENLYMVSDHGRVLSLLRKANLKKRIYGGNLIKINNQNNGYSSFTISDKDDKKTMLLHRVVCSSFKDNTENKPCVNHLDLDKSNNMLSNLAWCTYSENEKHSYKNGKKPVKSNLGNTGLKARDSKQVIRLDKDGNLTGIYESASLASKELKIGQGHISACCRGESKTYKGYVWKYITKDQYLKRVKIYKLKTK